MRSYLILSLAIAFEVAGTMMLKYSDGFTKPIFAAVVVIFYTCSFFLLSVVMKTLPVAIIYATWSAVGIVLVAVLSSILFGQKLDFAAILGFALIISGVLVANLFSKGVSIH